MLLLHTFTHWNNGNRNLGYRWRLYISSCRHHNNDQWRRPTSKNNISWNWNHAWNITCCRRNRAIVWCNQGKSGSNRCTYCTINDFASYLHGQLGSISGYWDSWIFIWIRMLCPVCHYCCFQGLLLTLRSWLLWANENFRRLEWRMGYSKLKNLSLFLKYTFTEDSEKVYKIIIYKKL